MKAKLCFAIVFFLILAWASPDIYAGSIKEEYELQERCGKSAADFYKEYDPNSTSYINHYNKKLNKCFILITVISKSKKSNYVIHQEWLYDVNDHKAYGSFFTTIENVKGKLVRKRLDRLCTGLGESCSSVSEWEAVIKPYLEE